MTAWPLEFAFAYGEPSASAGFRLLPEDFQVDEELGFLPCGEGEHLYLHIRKREQNTQWIAGQIARFYGVQNMDVGYCGLKDRHAVTSQWFSVYLPKQPTADWRQLHLEGAEVLAASRHRSKLKPGVHQANHFHIRLRDLSAPVDDRLNHIGAGVPNYFGEQRFGIEGGNLLRADALLVDRKPIKDRKQRGLVLSAARAYLFNRVLSARVEAGNWREVLPGEVESVPTGPLWGRGRPLVGGLTAALEAEVLQPWQSWCGGLEHVGLQQERRPLRCEPLNFEARPEGTDLVLRFGLAPGQYATAILREIAQLLSRSPMNGTG